MSLPPPDYDMAIVISPQTATNSVNLHLYRGIDAPEYDLAPGMSLQTLTNSFNLHLNRVIDAEGNVSLSPCYVPWSPNMENALSGSASESSGLPGMQTRPSSSTSLDQTSPMVLPPPDEDKAIVIVPQTATNSVNLHLDRVIDVPEYDLADGMSSQTLTNSVNLHLDRVIDAEGNVSLSPCYVLLSPEVEGSLSGSASESSSLPGMQTLMGVCENVEPSSSTSLDQASPMVLPPPDEDKAIVIVPQTATNSVNLHLDRAIDAPEYDLALMGVCNKVEPSSSTSLDQASPRVLPPPDEDKAIVIAPQTATNSVNLHLDRVIDAPEYDLAAGMSSQTLTNSVNLHLGRVIDAEGNVSLSPCYVLRSSEMENELSGSASKSSGLPSMQTLIGVCDKVDPSSFPRDNRGNPAVPQQIVHSSDTCTQRSVYSSSGSPLRDRHVYAVPSPDTLQRQMQNALCGSVSQSSCVPGVPTLTGAWHNVEPPSFPSVNQASIRKNPVVPQTQALRGPMMHVVQPSYRVLSTGHCQILNWKMSYRPSNISTSTDNCMVSAQTSMPCDSHNVAACNDQLKNRAHTSQKRPLGTAWSSTGMPSSFQGSTRIAENIPSPWPSTGTSSSSQGSARIRETTSSGWLSTGTPSDSHDSAKIARLAMFSLTPKVEPGTHDSGETATLSQLAYEQTSDNTTPAVGRTVLSMGSETGDLSVHTRTESGELLHRCTLCGKGVWDLNMHMKYHAGEKPHLCHVCGSGFKLPSGLVVHMRIHTGDRPYSCTLCEKSFTRASYLTTHMRYHTGERPYSCTLCEKSFTKSGNLTTHMRSHTGERPYSCTLCEKSFTQSSHLKSHMKTHTSERLH